MSIQDPKKHKKVRLGFESIGHRDEFNRYINREGVSTNHFDRPTNGRTVYYCDILLPGLRVDRGIAAALIIIQQVGYVGYGPICGAAYKKTGSWSPHGACIWNGIDKEWCCTVCDWFKEPEDSSFKPVEVFVSEMMAARREFGKLAADWGASWLNGRNLPRPNANGDIFPQPTDLNFERYNLPPLQVADYSKLEFMTEASRRRYEHMRQTYNRPLIQGGAADYEALVQKAYDTETTGIDHTSPPGYRPPGGWVPGSDAKRDEVDGEPGQKLLYSESGELQRMSDQDFRERADKILEDFAKRNGLPIEYLRGDSSSAPPLKEVASWMMANMDKKDRMRFLYGAPPRETELQMRQAAKVKNLNDSFEMLYGRGPGLIEDKKTVVNVSAELEAGRKLKKVADEAYRYWCGLNYQDYPLAVQREVRVILEKFGAILKELDPDKGGRDK